jgi:hypothetical protein
MSRPFFGRNRLEISRSDYVVHPTLIYGVLWFDFDVDVIHVILIVPRD